MDSPSPLSWNLRFHPFTWVGKQVSTNRELPFTCKGVGGEPSLDRSAPLVTLGVAGGGQNVVRWKGATTAVPALGLGTERHFRDGHLPG